MKTKKKEQLETQIFWHFNIQWQIKFHMTISVLQLTVEKFILDNFRTNVENSNF